MIGLLRYLPYAIGAILLIVLLYYRGEAIKAEAERDLLQDKLTIALIQNREKDKTIDLLKSWKEKSDGIQTDLISKIEKLAAESQDIQDEITNLGKTDADAKTWLDTPVPDAVRRVLGKKRGNGKRDGLLVPGRASPLRHERARSPTQRRPGQ
ncbi:hypothetical protein JHL16_18100 [Aestuariivirga sp. YIM B02566]|uniref:Uncharacterized protein n=1 Tax=Taklimakanibacter albus TaxID=2800327 RepID=A0ACC5R6I7_9HYPH|nr:hypothetical protein [Aestuariivirga sp. YIM B02566]MBK1868271.1 hypothetical protein [Aestuariivirga sp. YIM B02566]